MTSNKVLDELITAYEGCQVQSVLKEYLKMRQLVKRCRIYCHSPGGRFGEDVCGKCPACKLSKMFDKETE